MRAGDLAAGVAAGVAASAAVVLTQAVFKRVCPPVDAKPDPTETAAVRAYKLATGRALPERDRKPAGSAVHYAVGAALGGVYALAAAGRRGGSGSDVGVGVGVGVGYGLAVWLAMDEAGLALAGLKPPPWKAAPRDHAKGLISHLAFGAVLGAVFSRLARLVPAPERPRAPGR